jgi:methyl-accepting chemotaxis protein
LRKAARRWRAACTDTQEALNAIVDSFRQADAAIAQIASAAQEQSSGVEEITSAMTRMDEITQSNAAMAEESASSASSLEDQARRLTQAVAFFTGAGAGVARAA